MPELKSAKGNAKSTSSLNSKKQPAAAMVTPPRSVSPKPPLPKTSSVASAPAATPAAQPQEPQPPQPQSQSQAPGTLEEIEVLFVNSLEKKYECPVCSQVLRYPMQFPQCGHRCCSACLPELLRVSPRCPLDQTSIDKDRVLEDRAFQSETEALEVKCSYCARGCKWTGHLVDLMPHLETCDRGLTVCPLNCGIVFEKRFLDKHRQQDCAKRQVKCRLCSAEMLAHDEPDHASECPKAPVQCPNGCSDPKLVITRETLTAHLSACPKQETSCPLAVHGCEFKGKKQDVQSHLQTMQSYHTELLCTAFKSARERLETKEKQAADLEEKVIGLEKRICCMESVYGPQMIWRIENYAEKLAEAKSGKKVTIYSPPFLSHRHGYKMAASACLFGDGAARGKYMSVFICICKSDNDSLLQWPFSHRINFELLDQRDQAEARRNISYSFKPNLCSENRPFLDRPIGERNPSFGCVRFADLDCIAAKQFVRDDSIFIKVTVDCENIKPF